MKIKGAIFDLDGTLLDSMSIWLTAGERYLASKSIVPENNLYDKVKTMTTLQGAEYLRNTYKIPDTAEKIAAGINDIIRDFYLYHAKLKPGVIEFLKYLKDLNVKMSVASANEKNLIMPALARNGAEGFFSGIITCSETGAGKDSPVIFRMATQLMGTDRVDTAVFEDAAHAARTAKLDRFKVCGVYDASEKDICTIKKYADIYIMSFEKASEYFD